MKMTYASVLAVALVAPLSLGHSAPASENDYPTLTRYQFIEECMARHGGKNYDNLYRCACAIDVIATVLPHKTFHEADTADKLARMAGERGHVMRDQPQGIKALRLRLGEARAEADRKCFIRPARMKDVWPKF
jgi:hypothetical protein